MKRDLSVLAREKLGGCFGDLCLLLQADVPDALVFGQVDRKVGYMFVNLSNSVVGLENGSHRVLLMEGLDKLLAKRHLLVGQ